MTHQYLLIIEKGTVTVVKYDGKRDYRIVTNGGEKKTQITEGFWDWFCEAISLRRKKDKVDLCFIYDEPDQLLEHGLAKTEKTTWDQNKLKQALNLASDIIDLPALVNSNIIMGETEMILKSLLETDDATSSKKDLSAADVDNADNKERSTMNRFFNKKLILEKVER